MLKRFNREEQDKHIEERNFNKQFNQLPNIIKEYERREERIKENVKKRREVEGKEKQIQEEVGIINKPSLVGRYKYKMRKTDF